MESETAQLKLLKERIPLDEDVFEDDEQYEKVLNMLLDDSKYIALSIRFPFQDYYELDLPKKYENWQLRCALELYELIGNANIKAYSENGIAWTRDSGSISDSLKEEIMPKVGVVYE